MKSISKFLAFVLLLFGANAVKAQTALKADEAGKIAEVKGLVNSGAYTFKATKSLSQKSDTSSWRSIGDLDVSKDTLIVYLPNVGKTPATPVSASDAGITCTRFDYSKAAGQNGGWDITIKPDGRANAHLKEVKKLNLEISPRGYATLTVSSVGRSPMVYYGYITQHVPMFPQPSSASL